MEQEEEKCLLQKHLHVLDEKERFVIDLRYGLGGHPRLTQRQIAEQLGISRSYISRIEKRALGKLREKFDKPD